MPGILTNEPSFETLRIKELHPIFGAEIEGVDFSQPIPDHVFAEILAASAKVSVANSCPALCLTKRVRRNSLSFDWAGRYSACGILEAFWRTRRHAALHDKWTKTTLRVL